MLESLQEAKKELSSIKSVQTEFVKHSKLNRQIIQLEKDITSKKRKYIHILNQ
jgi:hypothetical protein